MTPDTAGSEAGADDADEPTSEWAAIADLEAGDPVLLRFGG